MTRAATDNPKVMISNATRLHAHHHAAALQDAGMLDVFVTSLWQQPIWSRIGSYLPLPLARMLDGYLAKRGHDRLPPEKVIQIPLPEIVRLGLGGLTRRRAQHVLHLLQKKWFDRKVARLVRERRPDIFVGFEISCARSFAAAKAIGAQTVLDLAGLDHRYRAGRGGKEPGSKPLRRALGKQKLAELALADHVLCVSDLARRSLIAGGVEADRIEVIHLGVDQERFSPGTRDIKSTSAPFSILYVGNLSREKGVDSLVDAVIDGAFGNARLTLVGSAPSKWTPPESDRIERLGYLSGEQLVEAYRKADICVLPSLWDSWGQVVPEAMACGTPVIVSDNCGSAELVRPGVNGWIVEAGSGASLRAALGEAYARRSELSHMGQQARLDVADLTWENYGRRIAAFHGGLG